MQVNDETVQGLLVSGAQKWPERPFVDFGDGAVWTRAQALQEAVTAASSLLRQGVQPGARVAVILPNGPDWLRAWWGLSLIGAVIVPLNPTFIGQILGELLATS